eukprot:g7584.t1
MIMMPKWYLLIWSEDLEVNKATSESTYFWNHKNKVRRYIENKTIQTAVISGSQTFPKRCNQTRAYLTPLARAWPVQTAGWNLWECAFLTEFVGLNLANDILEPNKDFHIDDGCSHIILCETSWDLAPTTLAPTTLAPTTLAPTTEAPTTEALTTLPPTTEPPVTTTTTSTTTTDAPVTTTTTDAPVTTTTSTETPSTEAPSTEAPSTEAPSTEAPSTEAPSTEAPSTEAPSTEAPSTEAPSTEAPSTDAPTTSPCDNETIPPQFGSSNIVAYVGSGRDKGKLLTVIWPPNHKLSDVLFTIVGVTDNCDAVIDCEFAADPVVVNEGDGHFPADAYITGPMTASIRSEKTVTGEGRIYRFKFACSDQTGNVAVATTDIAVRRK